MVTGLEVVALVTSIVSAFTGSASLVERLQQKRQDRRKAELKQTLKDSARDVDSEYQYDFQRLGRKFAAGDATGREQLQAQLIVLQQAVIQLLKNALHNNSGLDFSHLFADSRSARYNTIKALGDQFQRMAQAAPIPMSPPPPAYHSVVKDRTYDTPTNASRHCETAAEPVGESASSPHFWWLWLVVLVLTFVLGATLTIEGVKIEGGPNNPMAYAGLAFLALFVILFISYCVVWRREVESRIGEDRLGCFWGLMIAAFVVAFMLGLTLTIEGAKQAGGIQSDMSYAGNGFLGIFILLFLYFIWVSRPTPET